MSIRWEEFANSLNYAFSAESIFTIVNILLFILILLVIVAIVLILRFNLISSATRQGLAYEEVRLEMLRRKQLEISDNKRDWYRMDTELPFKWHPLPIPPNVKERNFHNAVAIDISGGGLLFYTDEIAALNEEVQIILTLDNLTLSLKGQIVRAQAEQTADSINYLVGIKFLNIRGGERDKIIHWIMRTQAEEIVNLKIAEIAQTEGEGAAQNHITSPTDSIDTNIASLLLDYDLAKTIKLTIPIEDNKLINLPAFILDNKIDDEGNIYLNIKGNLPQAAIIAKPK